MMRRILVLLTVALVMAAMMLAMAMPAFADQGGNPHTGSCGLGKENVHAAQESPVLPGASEAGTSSTEFCSGK